MKTVDTIAHGVGAYRADADVPLDVARQVIAATIDAVDAAARDAGVRADAGRKACETLPLMRALGRVLAADVVAPIDVPSDANSAMDGYAFAFASYQHAPASGLPIVGRALAGRPFGAPAPAGGCVRIMTGAVLPAGCDTVIPQELAEVSTAADGVRHVRFPGKPVQSGVNIRQAGEDLTRGAVALRAGTVLRPAHIGLLASLGLAEVAVRRRLRVAFFSTGDELRSAGQTLDPGCVYDSNRHTIAGMLDRLGVEAIDLGVVPDQRDALHATLRQAAAGADAVITSGGVSVGEADFVRSLLDELGDVVFWKMAMRPGRPFAFGRLTNVEAGRSALFFGLPGNPVAVMACFYHLVRDALLQLMGATGMPLPTVSALMATRVSKRAGRTEFLRGIAEAQPGSHELSVRLTGPQGSGILKSMSEANCFIVLEHARDTVEAGQRVEVIFFEGLV
ncbi:MAG: molybdopterin molybdotransferase MoeA [Janthinobacterium lividum]